MEAKRGKIGENVAVVVVVVVRGGGEGGSERLPACLSVARSAGRS